MASAEEALQATHQTPMSRIAGAMFLAPATYQDIERDPRALLQAFALVIAVLTGP